MRRAPRYIASALCLLTGSAALAFSFIGARWFEPRTTLHVGVEGFAPSGVAWASALREAAQAWTQASAFEFVVADSYLDPCTGLHRNDNSIGGLPLGDGDKLNGVDFGRSMCGNSFGTGVLAITMSLSSFGPLGFPVFDQTDVIFNSNYEWDIYSGPPRQRVDFYRVALHELGHVLGLDHSSATAAIMDANYGLVESLQADDIEGVNALYAVGGCSVHELAVNMLVRDSLASGDCRVQDLFGGSSDTSYVDVYRLTLSKETELDIALQSNELDAVLILTDANLGGIEIHDDTDGSCDARIRKRLQAGEYRILVNTYEEPEKCGGNFGAYSLTLSDSGLPLSGPIRNAGGGQELAHAVISGGASADNGSTFPARFAAEQAFDVVGRIVPDPAHIGLEGQLHVLVILGDGRQFMQDSAGNFLRFDGDLGKLLPRRSGVLQAQEDLPVALGLKGGEAGLAGLEVKVFLGYALASRPAEIWYGSAPIRFSIETQ